MWKYCDPWPENIKMVSEAAISITPVDQTGQVATTGKESSVQLIWGKLDSLRINAWQLPNSVVSRGASAINPISLVSMEERVCAAGYRSHPTANPFGRMTVFCAVSIS